MSTLYIAEYAEIQKALGGRTGQIPVEPPIIEQTVSIGGGSLQSSAFNAKTQLIRLHCDAICSVLFGVNPTAATTNGRLAANQTEFRAVQLGSGLVLAVISNT